jgi:hypothetical protein
VHPKPANDVRRRAGRLRFGPRSRRAVLSVHIIASVAWIGVDLCTLMLAVVGSDSSDVTTQRAAFVVLEPIANLLLVPLPLLALLTGILIALGTPWGLLRHYWVITSLVLTSVAAAAVLFALRPRLIQAAGRARHALDPGAAVGMLRQQIIIATSIALLVLCAVTAINVVKPWGQTLRARRAADTPDPGEPMTDNPMTPPPDSVDVIQRVTIACTPHEFLEFVMDIERYAQVDDKIAPILWSRRQGNVVTFACRPKLAGLRQPKVVQTVRLTPGERIDIALTPRPANRLAHLVAQFEASFTCREEPSGTQVTRTLRFRFTPVFRRLLVPLFRRRLPGEVTAELTRVRDHFATRHGA